MASESGAHSLKESAARTAGAGGVAVLPLGAGCGGIEDVPCAAPADITNALLLDLALELEFIIERHQGSLLGDTSITRTAAAGVEVGGRRWQSLGLCRDAAGWCGHWCTEMVASTATA